MRIRSLFSAIGSLLDLAGHSFRPIRRPRWMRPELSGPEQDAEALRSDWEVIVGKWSPPDPERAEARMRRRPK